MGDNARRDSGGFSLIEVIVAIAILGLITVPLAGGMMVSHRLNAQSQQVLKARLAVASAVENLMADGIDEVSDDYRSDDFSNVTVKTEQVPGKAAYQVTVSSDTVESVEVVTFIRPTETGGGA